MYSLFLLNLPGEKFARESESFARPKRDNMSAPHSSPRTDAPHGERKDHEDHSSCTGAPRGERKDHEDHADVETAADAVIAPDVVSHAKRDAGPARPAEPNVDRSFEAQWRRWSAVSGRRSDADAAARYDAALESLYDTVVRHAACAGTPLDDQRVLEAADLPPSKKKRLGILPQLCVHRNGPTCPICAAIIAMGDDHNLGPYLYWGYARAYSLRYTQLSLYILVHGESILSVNLHCESSLSMSASPSSSCLRRFNSIGLVGYGNVRSELPAARQHASSPRVS